MGLGVSVTVYATYVRHEIFRHAFGTSHVLLRSHSYKRGTV